MTRMSQKDSEAYMADINRREAERHTYTVESGRLICRDGKPYMSIAPESGRALYEAHDFAHLIVGFLNSL